MTARLGTRNTLLLGLGIFGTGLALLAALSTVDGGYLSALPGLMVVGVGMAFTMTPSTTAITGALPEEKQGVASALNDTVREVGGAIGIALLGSVLNSGYRSGVSDVASSLPSELATPVREGIGSALPTAAALGNDGTPIAAAARDAFMSGWHTTMWVGVALTAAAFVFVLVRGPRHERRGRGRRDGRVHAAHHRGGARRHRELTTAPAVAPRQQSDRVGPAPLGHEPSTCGDALRRLEPRATSAVTVAAAAARCAWRNPAKAARDAVDRLVVDVTESAGVRAPHRIRDRVRPAWRRSERNTIRSNHGAPVAAHGQSVKYTPSSVSSRLSARTSRWSRPSNRVEASAQRPSRAGRASSSRPLPKRREWARSTQGPSGKVRPLPQRVAENLLGRLGRDR